MTRTDATWQDTREVLVGFDAKPFDIFVIDLGALRLVGRKRPESYRPGEFPAAKSCLVGLSSLIGELLQIDTLDDVYRLLVRPSPAEKLAAQVTSHDGPIDLSYPLRRLVDGKETAQYASYWSDRANNPTALDDDEAFLREEAVRHVAPLLRPGSRLYDPACSTGAFLSHLSGAIPGAWTIGQDINSDMIRLAGSRLCETLLGDSMQPQCAPGSVDLLVCRHLNLDVMTSRHAAKMLPILVDCIAPSGLALIIGHTPVLLDLTQMAAAGLTPLRTTGRTPSGHALFQFYLLRKQA